MYQFFINMLKDTSNGTSSKRVITFSSFIIYLIINIVDPFLEVDFSKEFLDGLSYIVLTGIGFTTIEHFSVGKKSKNYEDENYYDQV